MPRRQKICAVYCIKNTINGRVYIGSSVDIHFRWYVHRRHLRDGKHHARKLQRSWNKYGEAAFTFEIVEVVDPAAILVREQFWIDYLHAADDEHGFNSNPASDSNRGGKLTDEHKAKIAAGVRGKKRRPINAEALKRHSEIRRGVPQPKLRGRLISAEQRAKISATLSGRKQSAEMVEKRKAGWHARFGDAVPEYIFRAAKASASMSPEEKSERMRKAWITRRAKKAPQPQSVLVAAQM